MDRIEYNQIKAAETIADHNLKYAILLAAIGIGVLSAFLKYAETAIYVTRIGLIGFLVLMFIEILGNAIVTYNLDKQYIAKLDIKAKK